MSDEEMKAAELRGYGRGYAAGKKRLKADISSEKIELQRLVFRRRAFLAALPVCIDTHGWKQGDKPIANVEQRVSLANSFAEEAMKYF